MLAAELRQRTAPDAPLVLAGDLNSGSAGLAEGAGEGVGWVAGTPFFSTMILFYRMAAFNLGFSRFSRKIRIPGKNGNGRYP